jgi:hypothetical protein
MWRKRVKPQRVIVWLLVFGLALALVVLGYRAWGVWRAARPLFARVETVQVLAANPSQVELSTLESLLQETHDDLVAVRDEARPFLGLVSRLGWLPGIGADLQAFPPLLDIAIDLTGAGKAVMGGLAPLLDFVGGDQAVEGQDAFSLAVHVLADAGPLLEESLALLESAKQRRADLDAAKLSPRLARLVMVLDRVLPMAQVGAEAGLLAPDMLGLSGPRTYLLLAQNSDELRPTGGFISGVGRVTLVDGAIVSLAFEDSYTVDDFTKPYGEPPAPLYEYMLSELWLFRDANWSPDFPTSAQKAAELYTYGQGGELDGVIAFDLQGAARLVGPLGPLEVEGWDEPATGGNFVGMMREAWNPTGGAVSSEWARTRKESLGAVAQAALDRVKRHPEMVDWLGLVQALWQVLGERHLLIYVEESAAADLLHAQGWDGSLRPSEGDYLMVVDANLGFNKVNPRIERKLGYEVRLRADGSADAVLELEYHHMVPENGLPCRHHGSYRRGDVVTYEGLMEGCYWNYLRVYVPEDSYLYSSSRHSTPGSYLLRDGGADGVAEVLSVEKGKAVFAQFFVVERGQVLGTRFYYDLPGVARSSDDQWRYTLLVQKQPGTDSTPVSLTLALPPGAHLLEASPASCSPDGEALTCSLNLNTDISVEVMYAIDK